MAMGSRVTRLPGTCEAEPGPRNRPPALTSADSPSGPGTRRRKLRDCGQEHSRRLGPGRAGPQAELPGLRPPVPSSPSRAQCSPTRLSCRCWRTCLRVTVPAPQMACQGHGTSKPVHWPTHLAHGLWDPKPAAAADETHGGLQAHLVAHRDVEGLGAVVVASQGLGQRR